MTLIYDLDNPQEIVLLDTEQVKTDADLFTEDVVAAMLPGASMETIRQNLPLLLRALYEVELAYRSMILMALATVAAEVSNFKPVSEYVSRWNTRARPYDRYDYRSDLGNQGPPDGSRYKGRGFIQLTGRHNYRNYGRMVGIDLENDPDQANDPYIAAKLLACFLKDRERKIQNALKSGNLTSARRYVNGGSHGLDEFTRAFETGFEMTA